MNVRRTHDGYVLLLVLLGLMSVGGVVLAGFTQQAKHEQEARRYEYNKRVLQQAKQALLMFAYNYPQTNGRGPGRLPCPDHDNDGTVDFPLDCDTVGRFPWRDSRLNIADTLSPIDPLMDASGETLWYAVSDAFDNEAGGIVNSDTQGTITIVDSSGGILYDGTAAGIAAVIIAPGPPLNRDNDSNGSYETPQSRVNPGEDVDPSNYLDTFNGFDNSQFVNGSNANADSFILGPVFDPAEGDIVVNDQMIIVTSDEIIEMAEKKVLETYRDTVREYLAFTGGVYPWLYNYAGVANAADVRSVFPTASSFAGTEQPTYLNPGNYGRIPSIFSNYFTDADSQAIETELGGNFTMSYPLSPNPVSSTLGSQYFNPSTMVFNLAISEILTGVRFDDKGDSTDDDGRLTGTLPTSPTDLSQDFFFWDNDAFPGAETGVWTVCPDDGDEVPELSDCHRDASENPDPGGPNANKEEIMKVTLTFRLSNPVDFDMYYSTPPTIVLDSAASGLKHATIKATFAGADVSVYPTLISADVEIDRHYHEFDTFSPGEFGSLTLADLSLSSMSLVMRYYPELPYWIVDNQWHDSVFMAYAGDYLPDTLTGPCTVGVDCLDIQNIGIPANNKSSLLVIAGKHIWINDVGPDLQDDLGDAFDVENDDLDAVFDARATNGNDKLLVIEDI